MQRRTRHRTHGAGLELATVATAVGSDAPTRHRTDTDHGTAASSRRMDAGDGGKARGIMDGGGGKHGTAATAGQARPASVAARPYPTPPTGPTGAAVPPPRGGA